MKYYLISLWLFLCMSSFAHADDVLVKAKLLQQQSWVGQKNTLQIDVMSPEGWAALTKVQLDDVDELYILPMENQGTRISENISGKSYSGQRYELTLLPKQKGVVTIPSLPLEIVVKSWGGNPQEKVIKANTKPVKLTVKQPPGTEGVENLFSATSVMVSQSWSTADRNFEAGDAINRTVVVSTQDVPSMMLPPMKFSSPESMSIYAHEPELADILNRGESLAKRTDSALYIFTKEGNQRIPEITVYWWNPQKNSLEKKVLSGIDVVIQGGVAAESRVDIGGDSLSVSSLLWGTLMLLTGVGLFWLVAKYFPTIFRPADSMTIIEEERFNQLKKLAADGDVNEFSQHLTLWITSVLGNDVARLDTLLAYYHSEQSPQEIWMLLNEAAKSKTPAAPLKLIVQRLEEVRTRWQRESVNHNSKTPLPPLNG